MTAAELVAAVAASGFRVVVGDTGPSLRRVGTVAHLPGDLMAELKARRDEVVAYLAGWAADGLGCDGCGRTWFCSPDDVRDCVTSPAFCDRPAPQPRGAMKGNQAWDAPCPWK